MTQMILKTKILKTFNTYKMKNTQEFIEAVRHACNKEALHDAQNLTDTEIIDLYIELFYEVINKQKEKIDWSITFNSENQTWVGFSKVANFADMAGYKQLWYNNTLYSKLNSSQWEKKNFTSKV